MRTGILSDESIRKNNAELFPLDVRKHDLLYGKPKLQKHDFFTGRQLWKRARPISRPRTPYMAHHEYAQMMNPLNVKQVHEQFVTSLNQSINAKPSRTLMEGVEEFRRAYPEYKQTSMQNAFFITEMGLEPANFFQKGVNQYMKKPDPTKMIMPLSELVQKTHEYYRTQGATPEEIKSVIEAYELTKKHMFSNVLENAYERVPGSSDVNAVD